MRPIDARQTFDPLDLEIIDRVYEVVRAYVEAAGAVRKLVFVVAANVSRPSPQLRHTLRRGVSEYSITVFTGLQRTHIRAWELPGGPRNGPTRY